ncbi:MAG: radical SAM family heme chaperone HemW [Alphaproteobacteria bacterium]
MTKRLSLYVHWPFCEAKCPYCDFNSHVRDRVDKTAYQKALLVELDYFAGLTKSQTLTSIFFGGGTPSLMPPEIPAEIISKSRDLWEWDGDIEITLEANPGSSEAKKFEAFQKAGVNRLSLGVQSFYDDALKFLGRVHNAGEARAAIKMAKETFPRFSFDLIYARPDQSAEHWQEELEEALTMATSHLSLYQLTLEKDTAFFRAAKRGKLTLPDDEIGADLFTLTGEIMEKAGLPRYEISNYARLGFESCHNLNYWQGGAYAGIGPGAHSRLFTDEKWQAIATTKMPEDWLKSVRENGSGIQESSEVPPKDRATEIIMTAFRLKEGLSKKSLKTLTGIEFESLVNVQSFQAMLDAGFISDDPKRVGLTPKGALLLDSVLGEILT